jgi:hypothetical protein
MQRVLTKSVFLHVLPSPTTLLHSQTLKRSYKILHLLLDSKVYHIQVYGIGIGAMYVRMLQGRKQCIEEDEDQREEPPTATDGGILATATDSHVISPGRRATA